MSDANRIRSNIQALNVMQALRRVNNQVGMHQLRLATGRRINSAGDDPAGLTIATKLQSRNRILQQIFDNIGEAKNLMGVAEGGLSQINDILTSEPRVNPGFDFPVEVETSAGCGQQAE